MGLLRLLLNWKTILAIGGATTGIILAVKVDPKDAGKTLEAEANAVSSIITGTNGISKR